MGIRLSRLGSDLLSYLKSMVKKILLYHFPYVMYGTDDPHTTYNRVPVPDTSTEAAGEATHNC